MSTKRSDGEDPSLGDVTGPQLISGRQLRGVPRVGSAWRTRAKWAVRGVGPPTTAIAVPGSDDEVSQRHARTVIDLALRIGEAMLSTGASSSEVVATVLRLTHAYEIRSTHIDITFTSITVSIHRGLDEDPLAVMRVVKVRSRDHTRLQNVQKLVDQIAHPTGERMEPEEARERLAAILNAPHPYRRWVATGGNALLAGGVVALFGGGLALWIVAALSAVLIDQTQRWLYRAGVAEFFSQAVAAAIPTTIAVLIHWTRSLGWEIPGLDRPSLVVIAGIILLLAGLMVLGAAQDAIEGYYVTAAARGLEMLVLTLGLAVGVAAVLGLAWRLGVPMTISAHVSVGGSPVVSTLAAAVIGAGFAIGTYTGFRATLVAACVCAGAWVIYEVMLLLELGPAPSVVLPAILVGIIAYVAHRVWRVPEMAIATAGIVVFLPGLAVYRAIFLIMEDTVLITMAATHFVTALSIALALAGGVWLGQFLARRPVKLDFAERRARRRSVGALR